jgi:hypothetical protein
MPHPARPRSGRREGSGRAKIAIGTPPAAADECEASPGSVRGYRPRPQLGGAWALRSISIPHVIARPTAKVDVSVRRGDAWLCRLLIRSLCTYSTSGAGLIVGRGLGAGPWFGSARGRMEA